MASEPLRAIQTALRDMNHDPGPLDGIWGKQTLAAIDSLRAAGGKPLPEPSRAAVAELPWIAEAQRVLGRHEVTDSGWLSRWLGSDGRALGDPAVLPWCGDYVETSIRLGLPSEPFPGDLGRNPYWARNWVLLGKPTAPTRGCVLVFARGSGGHVGFAMGQDDSRYFVLGGNQSNRVSVAPVEKSRMIAARWPATWPEMGISLPRMTSAEASSLNEA